MSSALTLIVLGNAYFLGSPPNSSISTSTGISGLEINQTGPTDHNGFRYTPGVGAHKIYTTAINWNQARKICKDEGADLAVINSPQEAEVIASIFTELKPDEAAWDRENVWIGNVLSCDSEGTWRTIHGQTLPEAGWDEWYEPKTDLVPHCGGMFRDGKLSWWDCARDLGFVCELPYHKIAVARAE